MLELKELISERMQEIYDELKQANGEYAVKREKCLILLNTIDKFVMTKGEQTITENDKQSLKEYMETNLELFGIEQEQYYLCGHLDCVSLLKSLKIFSI